MNTKIEDYEYFGRTELESFTVASDIEEIGSGAFSGCTGLKNVIFEGAPSVIGEGAFFGCSSLEEITIPGGLTKLGDHAFSACGSLKKVLIASSPESIGAGAFQGCKSLISIDVRDKDIHNENTAIQELSERELPERESSESIPSIIGKYKSIDGVLFSIDSDGGLTLEVFPQGRPGEYTTPENVSAIADGAFRGCTALEKVTLGGSVEYIGSRAFAGCSDIHIEIENCEIETGQLPFEETANVSFKASKSAKKNPFAAFDEPDFEEKLANIQYIFPVNKKFVVPKEKWTIREHPGNEENAEIVSYNGEEVSVTVPAKSENDLPITCLGDYALSPERGGIDKRRRDTLAGIQSVFLARSITEIGTGAFKNCSSLEYVLVPGGVNRLGDRAFSGCSSLVSAALPEGASRIGNGVFFGCKKLENVEIPEGVKEIGDLAFSGCERLTFMAIPEGVNYIGRKSFSGCRYLMYVTFPDSLEVVGMDAFKDTLWYSARPEGVIYAGKCAYGYKGAARNVELKEGTVSVSPAAFRNNEWISSIHIPESVTYIGDEAFFGCSKLDDIELPSGISYLGEHAFAACRMLRKIKLPDSIEKISEFLFSGCSALGSIDIPGSVKVIERAAFRHCANLREIHLPEGLTKIGDEAFIGCEGITDLYLPDSLTEIGDRAFAGLGALVIRAHEGSFAHSYAVRNNMKFHKL